MLSTCLGFVLKSVPFGESGLVVKILTDSLGAASFLVHGVKRKGKNSKAAHFSPMNHVQIQFNQKENRDLHLIKNISSYQLYSSLLTDFRKPPLSVYMAEALYKALSEGHHEEELYLFAKTQMEKLDEQPQLSHFPQQFLAGLIEIFGFMPHGSYSVSTPDFYLNESTFMPAYSGEQAFSVQGEAAKYISEIFQQTEISAAYTRETKREVRRRLEDYLKLHLDGRFQLLSGEVLEVVFDE